MIQKRSQETRTTTFHRLAMEIDTSFSFLFHRFDFLARRFPTLLFEKRHLCQKHLLWRAFVEDMVWSRLAIQEAASAHERHDHGLASYSYNVNVHFGMLLPFRFRTCCAVLRRSRLPKLLVARSNARRIVFVLRLLRSFNECFRLLIFPSTYGKHEDRDESNEDGNVVGRFVTKYFPQS